MVTPLTSDTLHRPCCIFSVDLLAELYVAETYETGVDVKRPWFDVYLSTYHVDVTIAHGLPWLGS
jgi:hypothetical protein